MCKAPAVAMVKHPTYGTACTAKRCEKVNLLRKFLSWLFGREVWPLQPKAPAQGIDQWPTAWCVTDLTDIGRLLSFALVIGSKLKRPGLLKRDKDRSWEVQGRCRLVQSAEALGRKLSPTNMQARLSAAKSVTDLVQLSELQFTL